MKKLITICAVAVVLVISATTQATTVDWKGVTWDVQDATAVVNGNGSLTLTSSVDHSFSVGLHANRLDSTFETVMNPWIQWSFAGHKGDILIDKEETIQPGNPTIQAGSNWEKKWAVNPSPPGHRRTVTRNQISYQ